MNTQRVLLVDDEEELRRSTAQALELFGLDVQTFSNADHVLELAGFGFDGVVVSDIRMPGMDGMTLMQKIRELDPELPVILVTGHGDVQLAVKACNSGGAGVRTPARFVGKARITCRPSSSSAPAVRTTNRGIQ